MTEKVCEIVNVVEKSRLEELPNGQVSKETWTEIELQEDVGKVSEDMAEFIWDEFLVDVEDEDIEVIEE